MVNSSSGWFPMPVAIPRSRSKSESRFHRLSGSPEKSFGTPALRVPITVEFTASSLLAEPSTHLPLLPQHPYGEKEKASCIIYRCLPASYPLLKDAYALMQRLKLDRTNFSSPLFINPLSRRGACLPVSIATIYISVHHWWNDKLLRTSPDVSKSRTSVKFRILEAMFRETVNCFILDNPMRNLFQIKRWDEI